MPDTSLAHAPVAIDTLIVAGGAGSRPRERRRGAARSGSRTAAPRARSVTSVCTGAFVLAAVGPARRAPRDHALGVRRASSPSAIPRCDVDAEPIYVRDGNVWTSAGVTAGMDLALALVEEDLDRDVALAIARQLVLFLRRPGNQAQFSATLVAQQPAREPLREVQRYVVEHLRENLSVDALAGRAHMSPRNFARAFTAETGVTPGRYVECVRLEAARRALEDTAEPIASVASTCGFGTAETMRRTFIRALHRSGRVPPPLPPERGANRGARRLSLEPGGPARPA